MSDSDRTRTLELSSDEARAGTARAVPGVVLVWSASEMRALPVRRALVIGRDAAADCALDDEGVSRRHVSLSPGRGALLARDLESRNGTFIDGRRIEGEAALPIGSVLRVGRALFVAVADATRFRARASNSVLAGMIGGPSLDPLRAEISALATLDSPILIQGESGTGTELAAASIHAASGRKGELVPINCAALPAQIVESELFGHARGAFSGAERARAGLFAQARGGTLFLDEIGELAPNAQAKLLRLLEDGIVRSVGEDKGRYLDVRVVAATHRDLKRSVEEGSFRLDLFHRIAASRVHLPPLRDRREDIPALAAHLAPGEPTLSMEAMEALLIHRWPGNVRELGHVLVAARARARGAEAEVIEAEHLALDTRAVPDDRGGEAQRTRIEDALRAAGGNVTAAARAIGMRRAGIYEEMRRLGVDAAAFRRKS